MVTYPEHEKLKSISDHSDKLGAFLEWLGENGYVLARWNDHESFPQLWPCNEAIEKILAKRFDIDLNVLEREKRQMLDALTNPTEEP